MRLLLLVIFFHRIIYAEVSPRPGETYDQAYQRLLTETAQRHDAFERERHRSIEKDLRENASLPFAFLKRKDGGAFEALTVKSFGRMTEGKCSMNTETGLIDDDSQFFIRPTGDGETFEIVSKSQPEKSDSILPSFLSLTKKSTDRPRWRFKKQLDGSYEVCEVNSGASLGGCNRWYIARLKGVSGPTFIQGAGDLDKIDANDIKQGSLGTCTLWAAVHSVLATRGPEEIEALFSPDSVAFPNQKPIPAGNQFLFYWDPKSEQTSLPIGASYGDKTAEGEAETWPVLLENAYTIWRRSLKKADSGANPAEVLSLLTDEKVKSYYFHPFQSKDKVFSCLRDASEKGQPTVCATNYKIDEANNPKGLSPSHAYAVKKVDSIADRLILIDPHGKTVELSQDEFFSNFSMAAHTTGEKSSLEREWLRQKRKVGDLWERATQ